MTEHELEITIPEIIIPAMTIKAKLKVTDLPDPEPIPEPIPERGTAITLINTGMESNPGQHDIYICNPNINTAVFAANMKPGALAGAYVSNQIVPRYGAQNAFLNGLRAQLAEEDYYHTGTPISINNRLVHPGYPTQLWLPRATRDLSLRMANYYVANLNPFFKGVMADESQFNAPKQYLGAYRTAVEWNEADLQKVHDDWNESVAAQFEVYKLAWGKDRFAIANSAGAAWNNDGMTVEASHILSRGEAGLEWFAAQSEIQRQKTAALSNAFDSYPILITWGLPEKIPGVYQGTGA